MWEWRLPRRVLQEYAESRQRTEGHGDGFSRGKGMPAAMWWIKTLYASCTLTKNMNFNAVVVGNHWKIICREMMSILEKGRGRRKGELLCENRVEAGRPGKSQQWLEQQQ